MPSGMLDGMPDTTTIKVPRALRERISQDASRRGITAASLISELLDGYEREQRFHAVGEAYAASAADGQLEETAEWDGAADDGLTT